MRGIVTKTQVTRVHTYGRPRADLGSTCEHGSQEARILSMLIGRLTSWEQGEPEVSMYGEGFMQ